METATSSLAPRPFFSSFHKTNPSLNFLFFHRCTASCNQSIYFLQMDTDMACTGDDTNKTYTFSTRLDALTEENLLFLEAWRAVDRAYYDKSFNGQSWFRYREAALRNEPMNTREETYAAIKKMLATLDGPFTRFLEPEKFKSLQSGTKVALTGVGLLFAYPRALDGTDKGFVVTSSNPDGPADKAGIGAGDIIFAINDASTENMDIEDAADRLQISSGSWSQLPIDVLDNIIKMLELPVDAVSFSGVCKPWRNVALGMHMSLHCKLPMHHFLPKRSPLPMLLHPGCEGPDTHRLYSLDERKIYGGFHLQELSNKWIIGSGAGWLVTVDTADPAITLVNPLTGKKIPLPHLSTVPLCPLKHDDNDPTAYWYIRKVIVCSYRGSLLAVALVSESKAIRFCRVGDSKWTKLENSPTFIDDIIIHNGKLYAVNMHTALFEIDITSLATVTMVAILSHRPLGKCFLVDLCGELVLISRIIGMPTRRCARALRKCARALRKCADVLTSEFEVYKLAEDEHGYFEGYKSETGMRYPEKAGHSWVRLENLGHHMVFIGYNHSLSLDSRVYPRCKGSCIYFADCRHDEFDFLKMRGMCNDMRHDVGVYDIGDRNVKHFEDFCCASSPMNMVWLAPNLSTEPEMQVMPR